MKKTKKEIQCDPIKTGKENIAITKAILERDLRIFNGESLEGYGSLERRKATIEDVAKTIELDLLKYKEPQRSGTAKGEPIGFSKNKLRAAYWMILFPNCLSLKDIAKKCGVSEGVLRVWRTQVDFKEKAQRYAEYVGERFVNFLHIWWEERAMDKYVKGDSALTVGDKTIMRKSYAEKYLNFIKPKEEKIVVINDAPDRKYKEVYKDISEDILWENLKRLPFYNATVYAAIIKGAAKHIDIPGAVFELIVLRRAAHFWKGDNLKLRKEWYRSFLTLTLLFIEINIDLIADPEFREKFTEEEAQEFIDILKTQIRDVVTTLAHE